MCSGVRELRGCKAGSPAGESLLCTSVLVSVFWFQLNPFLDAEKTNCRVGFFFFFSRSWTHEMPLQTSFQDNKP